MTSLLSRKTREDFGFPSDSARMAYCKETRSLLLHTNDEINYCHSSASGFSLQPQRTLSLPEELDSTSVQIATRMGGIFIGCLGDDGIYVFDGKSHKLIKKFAQEMDRSFNFIAVDETEHPQGCTVYATSTRENLLTKLDYTSGSKLGELSVKSPTNVILKDDKLYLICAKELDGCILVIDKHSLKIESKFALTGWEEVAGLCLDESGNVYATALDEEDDRCICSFDVGGNLIRQIPLSDFPEDENVVEMDFVDNDMIILTSCMIISTKGPAIEQWALNRFKLN